MKKLLDILLLMSYSLSKSVSCDIMDSRRDEILRLRKEGLTYAEIGRRFGITYERVRQIVNPIKRKTARNRPTIQPMLRTTEVAAVLGVHVNTLRHLSKEGLIEAYKINQRGDRRFRREDIIAFLDRCQE